MYKILSWGELNELSLDQLKTEYDKLTKVYARRMYEMNKQYGSIYTDLYGERMTASQLKNEFLQSNDRYEIDRYINAYQMLAAAFGGQSGITNKQINVKINFAKALYPHAKDTKEAVAKLSKENKVAQKLNKLGYDSIAFDDMSDLVNQFIMMQPSMKYGYSSLGKKAHEFNSRSEYREWLIDHINRWANKELREKNLASMQELSDQMEGIWEDD